MINNLRFLPPPSLSLPLHPGLELKQANKQLRTTIAITITFVSSPSLKMILSIPLLAAAFLSIAPFVSCQTPTSNQTLMQALADIPECQNYYQFLQTHPEVQSPPPGQQYVVFCPINEAVQRKLAAPAGSKIKRNEPDMLLSMAALTATGITLTRTAVTTSTRTSVVPSSSANSNSTAGAPRKRQVTIAPTGLATVVPSSSTTTGPTSTTAGSSPGGSLTVSTAVATSFRTSGPDPFALDPNQLTLKTIFNNPAFVNLGPGEVLRTVSFAAAPAFPSSNLKLVCGLGDVVNVIRGNIPFSLGLVHIIQE